MWSPWQWWMAWLAGQGSYKEQDGKNRDKRVRWKGMWLYLWEWAYIKSESLVCMSMSIGYHSAQKRHRIIKWTGWLSSGHQPTSILSSLGDSLWHNDPLNDIAMVAAWRSHMDAAAWASLIYADLSTAMSAHPTCQQREQWWTLSVVPPLKENNH